MINLIGKRVDKVVVVSETDRKITGEGKKRRVYRVFICLCDCGNEVEFTFPQLTNKKRKTVICRDCLLEERRRRRSQAEEKKRRPVFHTCGVPISDHKRCKLCDVVLCDEGIVQEYKNNYCKKCYENYYLQKKIKRKQEIKKQD